MTPVVTVCFTSHRAETIPFALPFMEQHDVIVLEEAPNENLLPLLKKKMSVDTYILEEGFEFPEFSKRYYRLLRSLHARGKEIVQVEPYLERLICIHTLFAEGKQPSDIEQSPSLNIVYRAEREATRALFRYYEASMTAPFDEVIESVRNFATSDAVRFRIRDTMRAHAIAHLVRDEKKYYIETGGIHRFLVKILRNLCRGRWTMRVETLMTPEYERLTGQQDVLAPGDILTLHYVFGKRENVSFERLLAARSLIYIMLLEKNEMLPSRAVRAPHLENEIAVTRFVNRLSLSQCRELFETMRSHSRREALEIAASHLA